MKKKSRMTFLLSFDIATEKFSKMSLPDDQSNADYWRAVIPFGDEEYDIVHHFFYGDGSYNVEENLKLRENFVRIPIFVRSLVSPHPYPYNRIQNMLTNGIDTWAPKLSVKRAIVVFSSPNIAEEMHVGHLRSTIFGDAIARMLEYSKVDVLRRNHVGDWGTQFGMLIEYLFEKFPDGDVNDQDIGEIEVFYKASKQRFDGDDEFKERARKAVVALQSGKEEKYQKARAQICEISRRGFEKVYQRLGVHLEEMGESFCNTYIPLALKELNDKGLIEDDLGSKVIKIIGGKRVPPLVVMEKNGGYNYASTDLAALWYRLSEEKADWIIYVTDVGKGEHFKEIFAAAKSAEWLPADESEYPKTSHVGFRTRSTEGVKLVDLLHEAKTRCKAALLEQGKGAEWTAKELEQTAEAVGYGAVKYAELKYNILTNYTFNSDQMLNDKEGQISWQTDDECMLGLHLLQFAEVVEEACTNWLPHVLCEYLYVLSKKFTSFYSKCKVVGSAEETSRLLLCEATSVVMRKCFQLLGITPLYNI